MITQAAWQLGPLSDNVREWHTDLAISSFGNTLLHEMECLLVKIKANWLEGVTIRTIGASDSSYLHHVSSVPSAYLQPSLGFDNGSGYFQADVCAVEGSSKCIISMDKRTTRELRLFAR